MPSRVATVSAATGCSDSRSRDERTPPTVSRALAPEKGPAVADLASDGAAGDGQSPLGGARRLAAEIHVFGGEAFGHPGEPAAVAEPANRYLPREKLS